VPLGYWHRSPGNPSYIINIKLTPLNDEQTFTYQPFSEVAINHDAISPCPCHAMPLVLGANLGKPNKNGIANDKTMTPANTFQRRDEHDIALEPSLVSLNLGIALLYVAHAH
jgi:hypothetical protein